MNMLRFVLLVVVVGPTLTASADVIAPPPERCPEGSLAVDFCHGPPTCRVATCESDADCGAGTVCADVRLCTTEYCCSGRCCGGGCGSAPTVYTHVFGPCGASGECGDFGAECTMQKVCVPGTNPVDAGPGTRDGGSTGTDGGPTEDAGGTGSTDAGRREDAGRTANDAGGTRDAGGGEVSGGGCCSVAGSNSALGGALFLAALGLVVARRLRRR